MSKLYHFDTDFEWAESMASEDIALLRKNFPPAAIYKANARLDKLGCDYIIAVVTFDENREPHVDRTFFVDFKRRRRGASRYWQRRAGLPVPELALELGDGGGLFKSPVITSGLVYVFDPSDYPFAVAVDFDELRQAALVNRKFWCGVYRTITQHNQRGGSCYATEVTYVPLPAIEAAGVRVALITKGDNPIDEK